MDIDKCKYMYICIYVNVYVCICTTHIYKTMYEYMRTRGFGKYSADKVVDRVVDERCPRQSLVGESGQ